ncbi:MAG: branched-chain amino acid ABC transporter permease [Nitriliruptoraceae bacterium]
MGTDILFDALRTATGPTAAAYALLAIGLNMHFGYTGLLNFGQAGFMLIGAYGVAITVSTFGGPLWLGVLMGLLGAIVLALLLGVPTLRLRADYLAITTIAAAEILRLLFRSEGAEPITGGVFGLRQFGETFYALNPIPPGRYLGPLALSAERTWVMLVGWGLVVLMTGLLWALMRSPWGRVIKSIREDEDAARSLGKNVFSYKMQSLMLGGAIGALGGSLFALALQTVQPDTFLPQVTFYAFAILILGGTASTWGPAVGAVLFWFLLGSLQSTMRRLSDAGALPEFFGANAVGAITLTFVGALIMLLMIYRPQGILGDKKELQLDVS